RSRRREAPRPRDAADEPSLAADAVSAGGPVLLPGGDASERVRPSDEGGARIVRRAARRRAVAMARRIRPRRRARARLRVESAGGAGGGGERSRRRARRSAPRPGGLVPDGASSPAGRDGVDAGDRREASADRARAALLEAGTPERRRARRAGREPVLPSLPFSPPTSDPL